LIAILFGGSDVPAHAGDKAKHFVLILLYHRLYGSAPNWEEQQ
jgi:hypothetical protein